MNNELLNTISEYEMLKDTTGVVLGISGGSDSMCLLFSFGSILKENNIPFCCVHINHSLRGSASDNDEQFVVDICKENNIEVFSKKYDVNSISKQNKKSIEETARNIRYSFFNEILVKTGYNKIATAHNLSDSFETTLLNLARGSGIKGLLGIPPKRDNIIRPLINVSKDEIENYCRNNKIPFVIDATNFENIYARNKIRNRVLPILEELNENFLANYKMTISTLKDDNDFLINMAKNEYENAKNGDLSLDFEHFFYLQKSLKYRVLQQFLKQNCAFELTFNKFCEILEKANLYKTKKTPQKIQIKASLFIKIIYNQITIINIEKHEKVSKKLQIGENTVLNKQIILDIKPTINNLETTFLIAFDIIKNDIYVRNREISDKISIKNRNTKTLKKIMIEKKIHHHKRDSLLVFVDKNNEIICVENVGISSKFEKNENSKQICYITITNKNN